MRYLKQFEVDALPSGSEITVTFGDRARELVLLHDEEYPWTIAVDDNGSLVHELIWCDSITRVMLTADARKLEKAREEARR
jgi:hypothetical protein